MKEMTLEEMKQVEGGARWVWPVVGCAALGVAAGILFSPVAGIAVGVMCGASPAY